jgi:hypothetical protein
MYIAILFKKPSKGPHLSPASIAQPGEMGDRVLQNGVQRCSAA